MNWEETAAAIGSALTGIMRSLAPTIEGVLVAFGRQDEWAAIALGHDRASCQTLQRASHRANSQSSKTNTAACPLPDVLPDRHVALIRQVARCAMGTNGEAWNRQPVCAGYVSSLLPKATFPQLRRTIRAFALHVMILSLLGLEYLPRCRHAPVLVNLPVT